MAHLTKFNKGGGVALLLSHFERKQNENGEYIKFGNQDIDLARTNLNYNLADKSMSAVEVLERCKQHSSKKIRDNMNIMCSWVITVPKDLAEAKHKEFFEQSFLFLQERYGKENVISSFVHLDETTPHMHFAFTPITKEGKLSAKEVCNRFDLQCFHYDLQKHLEDYFKCDINVLNNATLEGNKEIKELKQNTINQLEEKIKGLNDKIKTLNTEIEKLELSKTQLISEKEVNAVKSEKTLLGGFTNSVSVNENDFNKLKNTAKNVEKVQSDIQVLKNKMSALNRELKGKNDELEKWEKKLEQKEKQIDQKIKQGISDGIEKKSIKEKIEQNKIIQERDQLKKTLEAIEKVLPPGKIKELLRQEQQSPGISL